MFSKGYTQTAERFADMILEAIPENHFLLTCEDMWDLHKVVKLHDFIETTGISLAMAAWALGNAIYRYKSLCEKANVR